MLSLPRREHEKFTIRYGGEELTISVDHIGKSVVQFSFSGPLSFEIKRTELIDESEAVAVQQRRLTRRACRERTED